MLATSVVIRSRTFDPSCVTMICSCSTGERDQVGSQRRRAAGGAGSEDDRQGRAGGRDRRRRGEPDPAGRSRFHAERRLPGPIVTL